MIQQITLEEWNSYYSNKVSEVLPENEEVFFKDKYGTVFKGYFFKSNEIDKGWFETEGIDFDISEIEEWHSVRVDI